VSALIIYVNVLHFNAVDVLEVLLTSHTEAEIPKDTHVAKVGYLCNSFKN